jgi:hypothetical protein
MPNSGAVAPLPRICVSSALSSTWSTGFTLFLAETIAEVDSRLKEGKRFVASG